MTAHHRPALILGSTLPAIVMTQWLKQFVIISMCFWGLYNYIRLEPPCHYWLLDLLYCTSADTNFFYKTRVSFKVKLICISEVISVHFKRFTLPTTNQLCISKLELMFYNVSTSETTYLLHAFSSFSRLICASYASFFNLTIN